MWSGAIADIPANWSFCNGADGTPNLRDLFVIGAKQDDGGIAKTNVTGALTVTGGNISHTHTAISGTSAVFRKADALSTETHLNPYYALAYIMHNPGI